MSTENTLVSSADIVKVDLFRGCTKFERTVVIVILFRNEFL